MREPDLMKTFVGKKEGGKWVKMGDNDTEFPIYDTKESFGKKGVFW